MSVVRVEPRSGVPFARIADILGERISVLPFSDYCDPLVAEKDDWSGLIDVLLAEGLPVVLQRNPSRRNSQSCSWRSRYPMR
ncbi:MAG: hypothetical protein ACYC66_01645 [Chloroflexota bacterium]